MMEHKIMKKFIILMAVIFLIFPVVSLASTVINDNFEYSVTRAQEGATDAIVAQGKGWTGGKSLPEGNGACGYIYTVSSIPGYAGSFPGTASSSVLAMEFLVATNACCIGDFCQTDLYLSRTGASQSTIPANSWFQYWIYINHYASQLTTISATKWLYPCIDGTPTCSGSAISFLHLLKTYSYNPYIQYADGAEGNTYSVFEAIGGDATYIGDVGWGDWKLGHNQSSSASSGLLSANQWILVKIHIDISGNSSLAPANQGVYQEWHKTVGGNFVLVSDWIGGVTPNFTWDVTGMAAGHETGQKSLKLGTTWNASDGWVYLDDFVLATTEADLPTYGGASPPSTPSGITVIYD